MKPYCVLMTLWGLTLTGLTVGSGPGSPATVCAATAVFDVPDVGPAKFPGLLAGTLSHASQDATTFCLTGTPHRSDWQIGQVDQISHRVVAFVALSDQAAGKSLRLRAVPMEYEPAVTIQKRGRGFQFFDRGRPVLFYQEAANTLDGGAHFSANYVHPLIGLDGQVLTQDFPNDHHHHHGVFWAWHQIWVGDTRAGDYWADVAFLPVVTDAQIVEQGPIFATLRASVDWTSPYVQDDRGHNVPFVKEDVLIRLYRAVGDFQYVDFTITLHAQRDDIKIGGSEDVKGYSGFTARLKPPTDITIIKDGQKLDGDVVGGTGSWIDVSGTYPEPGAVAGVGMLSHPTLVEFPPKWLLRHYGAQNVIYPGRHAVPLPKGQPLTLRHRLVLHRGDTQQAQIAEHQKLYELSGAVLGP